MSGPTYAVVTLVGPWGTAELGPVPYEIDPVEHVDHVATMRGRCVDVAAGREVGVRLVLPPRGPRPRPGDVAWLVARVGVRLDWLNLLVVESHYPRPTEAEMRDPRMPPPRLVTSLVGHGACTVGTAGWERRSNRDRCSDCGPSVAAPLLRIGGRP